MLFKCGTSIGDWLDARNKRHKTWHAWYAWRPVRVASGICAWLEVVERAPDPDSYWPEDWSRWMYRTVSNV